MLNKRKDSANKTLKNTRVGPLMVRVETVVPEKLQSRITAESPVTMVLPAEADDPPRKELELHT